MKRIVLSRNKFIEIAEKFYSSGRDVNVLKEHGLSLSTFKRRMNEFKITPKKTYELI